VPVHSELCCGDCDIVAEPGESLHWSQAYGSSKPLADGFADNGFNLFSLPYAFQALSQFRFLVSLGELSDQSSSLSICRCFER